MGQRVAGAVGRRAPAVAAAAAVAKGAGAASAPTAQAQACDGFGWGGPNGAIVMTFDESGGQCVVNAGYFGGYAGGEYGVLEVWKGQPPYAVSDWQEIGLCRWGSSGKCNAGPYEPWSSLAVDPANSKLIGWSGVWVGPAGEYGMKQQASLVMTPSEFCGPPDLPAPCAPSPFNFGSFPL